MIKSDRGRGERGRDTSLLWNKLLWTTCRNRCLPPDFCCAEIINLSFQLCLQHTNFLDYHIVMLPISIFILSPCYDKIFYFYTKYISGYVQFSTHPTSLILSCFHIVPTDSVEYYHCIRKVCMCIQISWCNKILRKCCSYFVRADCSDTEPL